MAGLSITADNATGRIDIRGDREGVEMLKNLCIVALRERVSEIESTGDWGTKITVVVEKKWRPG